MKNLSLAQARGLTGAWLSLAGPAPGCRWIQARPTHASAFSKCHALRAFSCGGALERQERARCVRPLKATVPILSTCNPLAKASHMTKPKTSRWARNVLCPRGQGIEQSEHQLNHSPDHPKEAGRVGVLEASVYFHRCTRANCKIYCRFFYSSYSPQPSPARVFERLWDVFFFP